MLKQAKYIAEGFKEDVDKLLKDFVAENSVEFSKFAEIWKKHHFSLIFTGRPDSVETSELTNEAYRISMHFLSSLLFSQRVGVVYTLYALYRNQIAEPPVKIRVELSDWRLIQSLHCDARNMQCKTLHYVIDYLINNSFLYVSNYSLKGPLIGTLPKVSKDTNVVCELKTTYKSDINEYKLQNNLKRIQELRNQYAAVKKGFEKDVPFLLSNECEVYDSLISELDNLENPVGIADESIGSIRSRIKHRSFLKKSLDRFGHIIEEDNSESHPDYKKEKSSTKRRGIKNKRKPRHKRKVGRPRKNGDIPEEEEEETPEQDCIDFTHLIEQQKDFYLPPEDKKFRSKPGGCYYKLSPKHEPSNLESDPDNPDS